MLDSNSHLARVDVSGVARTINIGLLEEDKPAPGDWVLIHVGFAMSKIDEREAELALASLKLMGQAYGDELAAFWSSQIAAEPGGQGPGGIGTSANPSSQANQRNQANSNSKGA